LADDPTVYEYDAVYDKLKQDEAAKSTKTKEKEQDKKVCMMLWPSDFVKALISFQNHMCKWKLGHP
jgi:hypothetical protein